MSASVVNGRFRVELSANVFIQKTKRAELAAKVQTTALVIIFSAGIIAAAAIGNTALAVLLSVLAKMAIFKEPFNSSNNFTFLCENPVGRAYVRLLRITLDSRFIEVSFC